MEQNKQLELEINRLQIDNKYLNSVVKVQAQKTSELMLENSIHEVTIENLKNTIDELHKQKTALADIISEKDEQIEKLHKLNNELDYALKCKELASNNELTNETEPQEEEAVVVKKGKTTNIFRNNNRKK